jgi:anaerobic magnesium-protoporphyrin IX monomethyl ester cyclase
VHITDANIEAFHHTLSPEVAADVVRRVAGRRDALLRRSPATPDEERELTELLRASAADPDDARAAVAVLQSADGFYDYARYRWAVDRIVAWMTALGCLGVPGQFRHGFELRVDGSCNLSSTADLADLARLERINRPFQRYYVERLLPALLETGPDLVGLNVTYTAQLPFALWIGHLVREAGAARWIVCGGTEVSDVWKYLADRPRFFDVFAAFDAAVVGEGESEFVALLDSLERHAAPRGSGSTLANPRYGAAHSEAPAPRLRVEPLAAIPRPDYSDLPWDLYLSPHRFVYYSPTRGCYWNRCTFCDYGLNGDAPTSPWRQDRLPRILDDLEEIAGFAEFVYFSVDVLAPAMQLRLAEGLIARGIELRWGAEIRLEHYWDAEKCRTLRRSGCVAVSVGFESACQRILDLIDKGTRTPEVLETIRNLHQAGVAVQMMGFTGFPTETFAEAQESIAFLERHRDLWTFGGLGTFILTAGAIVARDPERFGVSDVRGRADDDILRSLQFDAQPRLTEDEDEKLDAGARRLRAGALPRPWLGGVDTPHSYFYHARFGAAVRAAMAEAAAAAERQPGPWRLNGRLLRLPRGCTLVRADGRMFGISARTATYLAALDEAGDPAAAAGSAQLREGEARLTWELALRNRFVLPPGVAGERPPAVARR